MFNSLINWKLWYIFRLLLSQNYPALYEISDLTHLFPSTLSLPPENIRKPKGFSTYQDCSISFLTKDVVVVNKFLFEKLYQHLGKRPNPQGATGLYTLNNFHTARFLKYACPFFQHYK